MKVMYRCCVFVLLLLFSVPRASLGTAFEPIWERDFTGPLDQTVWDVLEGDSCAEGIYGWVNNEEQSYDEAGVSIDGGSFVALGGAQRVTGI